MKRLADPMVHKNTVPLETLVLAAQKGDETAFSQLVTRLLPLVRRQATKYKSQELDADDLLQEGFIGLLSAVRGYHTASGKPFLPYVSVCVQNSILSALRKTSGGRSVNPAEVVPWEDDFMETPAPSLEEQQDLREKCETLWQSVATRLSNTEKQVLKLFLVGLSYGEIAERLEITPKSVDNALQRVRAKLKK